MSRSKRSLIYKRTALVWYSEDLTLYSKNEEIHRNEIPVLHAYVSFFSSKCRHMSTFSLVLRWALFSCRSSWPGCVCFLRREELQPHAAKHGHDKGKRVKKILCIVPAFLAVTLNSCFIFCYKAHEVIVVLGDWSMNTVHTQLNRSCCCCFFVVFFSAI